MSKNQTTRGKRGQPWWLEQDPSAGVDGDRYDNIIPSRGFITKYLTEQSGPLPFEELARVLKMDDGGKIGLERRLGAMCRDGQLIQNRSGAFAPVQELDLIAGRVIAHRDGFGFLVPDEGEGDLFLHAKQMARVWHGDRVVARLRGEDQRGRKEGAIVEVLERNTQNITGKLVDEHDVFFVIPDNPRLTHKVMIPARSRGKAKPGQIVTVKITEQPHRHGVPIGEVSEILGEHMDAGMETDVALRSHGIPHEWPEAVNAEAKLIPSEVPEKAKEGRLDLRDMPLVTIDGEDARDFDDAVHAQPTKGGWKLWVAIADVAEYVQPGSALDIEATARSTSVYFPSRVVPMLPEVLSNGLCSINPDVDRLCMVCEMDINRKGKVKKTQFHEGVMRSHARLTYNKVAAILIDNDQALRAQYEEVVPDLEELHALYKVLRKARDERGAMDFDTVETRIVFTDDKKVDRIVPVVRNDAHMLIEECMIAANVEAAKFLAKHKCPALHRNHPGPKPAKLESLRTFLFGLGLKMGGGDKPSPSDYLELSLQIQGRPDKSLIQTVMLRSLSQAVYSPPVLGHFGLATDYYAHFTSPIRRYPDLLVHRGIKHILRTGGVKALVRAKGKGFAISPEKMAQLGEQCSANERRADEATRDVMDWLKCEFMRDKVGGEFPGIISAVTPFGIFVQLKDIYVEGLVHVSTLQSDFYHHEPARHELKGQRTGRTYRLGDEVMVIVAAANLDERKVDFNLVEEYPDAHSAPPRAKKRKPRSKPAARTDGQKTSRPPATNQSKPRSKGPRKSTKAATGNPQGKKS
jgi:ribonuclease R